MNRALALLATLVAISFVSVSQAESLADCGHAYDKCKRDVANMFDKRPCRKKREACEQRVAQEQRNQTKNRMMNGIVEVSPGDAIRRPIGQLTGREAAEQRLREREMERGQPIGVGVQPTQPIGVGVGSGMRGGYEGDAKAEAQRRLRERQEAKAPGNGMRENVKSN